MGLVLTLITSIADLLIQSGFVKICWTCWPDMLVVVFNEFCGAEVD